MAAPKKITPQMEAEILRRRADGDGIVSIAVDLDLAHQTVSKVSKRDAQKRASERERQSRARRKPGAAQRRSSEPAERIIRHCLLPTVFASWEERLAYYAQHKLESEADWLNYNDALNGRETPTEQPAGRSPGASTGSNLRAVRARSQTSCSSSLTRLYARSAAEREPEL